MNKNPKYRHSYTLSATDIDNQYQMMPIAILKYFQDCFARYMSCLHLAAFDLKKQDKLWIITEFAADCTDNDAFWSEEITVELWISQMTPLRIYSDFKIHKEGIPIAKGTSCWSILNANTRQLERTDFLEGSLTVLAEEAVAHTKVRFPSEGLKMSNIDHKVNLLDLDFNGHVNNMSYLSIAMLTTTSDFFLTHKLKHLNVKWLHETYQNDTTHCQLECTDPENEEYIHTLTNDNSEVVAKILSQWGIIQERKDISEILDR